MVADTSFQLPVLDSLTTYWWSVAGVNPAGEGDPGVPWEFKTKEFTADPSVLGLWRMNEPDGTIVFDLTLNSNDGIAVGTSVVNARYGTGREFNGTSDYIDLPESPRLFKPGPGLTVEAWLYLQTYPSISERAAIVSTGSLREYELAVTAGGGLQGYLHSSSGPDSIEGRTTLPLKTWNHVALTYDGSFVRLWVNGVLDGERSHSGSIEGSAKSADLLIGACARNEIATELLTGVLDEVRIMNVARMPEEFALQLPPAGLEATPGPDHVRLAWMNGRGGAPLMRYRIYRGEDSSTASLIDSTGAEWFVDSTGLPLQDYTYRVAAVDSTGFEGHSARPVRAASLLGVPRQVSPAKGEAGVPLSTEFRWTQVRAAERYRLKVSADSGLTQSITDSVVSDTVVAVNGVLERGRRYFWRVGAVSQSGQGAWSETHDFRTIVDTPTPSDPVIPPDQALVAPDSVLFIWTTSKPEVEKYWFEIATDSGFTNRDVDSTLTDTTTAVLNLVGPFTYWWRVRAYNEAGWGPFSSASAFTVPVSWAEDGRDLPREYGLSQNYPNPFNPQTVIAFELPAGEHVKLSVFDMLGREVAVLIDERRDAGRYHAVWNGARAASGVYVYRLTAGSFTKTRTMLLLK